VSEDQNITYNVETGTDQSGRDKVGKTRSSGPWDCLAGIGGLVDLIISPAFALIQCG
jgi:hypothetical protein